MKRLSIVAAAAAGLILSGCGNQGGGQSSGGPAASGAPAAALTNPTDFPLSADAKILSSKPFTQTVTAAQGQGASVMAQGAGTYSGNSVVAQTSGTIADAKAWLQKTESAPPSGYTVVSSAQHPQAVALAAKYGVSYAVFRNGPKSAVIAVIDSKKAHDKLGFVVGLADKYKMVPEMMRAPIDNQVKQRLGMSITEALDPSAPVGMTVEALRTIQANGQPAIVEVDASKH